MNWNNELQAAASEDEVITVVTDFLAGQDQRFWSQVPEAAHPDDVETPEDVHRWHHDLVNQLKATKPASMPLQELCVLFLRASVRLHQIDLGRPVGPSNDELDCASRPHKPHWRF